jgi:hypothetical protein
MNPIPSDAIRRCHNDVVEASGDVDQNGLMHRRLALIIGNANQPTHQL